MNAYQIANTFAALLRDEVGEETIHAINRANDAERNPNVCHSHDYCDANMVLLEAFQVHGVDPDAEGNENLWDAAWMIARRSGFAPQYPY